MIDVWKCLRKFQAHIVALWPALRGAPSLKLEEFQTMIEIRPIWLIEANAPDISQGPLSDLLRLERSAVQNIRSCIELASANLDDVDEILFLEAAANADLTAGCELARCGYLKQAFSLWRSWFEQSLFALYFLEAPLHRMAWKVSESVSINDNPQYRLMLHQLINDSGERHPFGLVYGDRYEKILSILKIDAKTIPKASRPVQRAGKVLTLLSQGVHGTYQPPRANAANCESLVKTHGLPALDSALQTLFHFWLLFLTDLIALPPEFLISLREGKATMDDPSIKGLDLAEDVLSLGPLLKQVFPVNP